MNGARCWNVRDQRPAKRLQVNEFACSNSRMLGSEKQGREREDSWVSLGPTKTIPGDPRATRIEVLTITLTVLCTVTDVSLDLKSYFSPELTMQPGKILRYPFFCATFSVLALHFSPESWGERDRWHLWFVGTKCDKRRWDEQSTNMGHINTAPNIILMFSLNSVSMTEMSPDVLLAPGMETMRRMKL